MPNLTHLFPDSRTQWVERDGVRLFTRRVGQGKPLLLLHGHPQSMAMWHAVAPVLAKRHTLVLMDLRGYGDSDRPPSDEQHSPYSKREMALDAMAVMQAHGFEQFDVLAHDRGARVAHRLAIDHPQAVQRLMLLDIAPTLAMYERTNLGFATKYWHWFFLIQPPPLPETLIDADPVRYLRACMGSRRHDGLAVFSPQALSEYERCIARAGSSRGICEDYRASFSVDLDHDRADIAAGRQLAQPLHVVWGEQGAVGANFDVLALWRERAAGTAQVSGEAFPCSHYIAEEMPDRLIEHALTFFN